MSNLPPTLSYQDIYEAGLQRARERGALDLLDLGAETRSQNRLNRAYMDSLTLETRFLGSGPASLKTTLFGREVAYPIQCAPLCEGRFLNRVAQQFWQGTYLEEFAQGVAEAGAWLWVGHVGSHQLQRMINAGAPVVRLVKPLVNQGYDENVNIIHQLKEAEDRGCVAVGMDVDVFFGEKTGDEYPYRYPFGPKSMDELRRFVAATNLPFIVKGVLSVSDALKCRDLGVKAIVVSNHGGESLDYAVPVLRVLPHIRQAVPEMTIFVDSGFKRGSDILKALALGADAVCVLTILMIAYAGHRARGVADMLGNLAEELRRNMSMCGCPTVTDIDPSLIWFPYPDPRRGESG